MPSPYRGGGMARSLLVGGLALVAGLILGPSVLGALWPEAQQALFPAVREQKSMIDAISQIGVLMLLLLTGMETDVTLVRRAGREINRRRPR